MAAMAARPELDLAACAEEGQFRSSLSLSWRPLQTAQAFLIAIFFSFFLASAVLGKGHFEHAVLEVGLDLVGVHSVRDLE